MGHTTSVTRAKQVGMDLLKKSLGFVTFQLIYSQFHLVHMPHWRIAQNTAS